MVLYCCRRSTSSSWMAVPLIPQLSSPARPASVSARARQSACSSCAWLASMPCGPGMWCAYYRLGKKRPCSGILSRYSRFALTIQAIPTMLPRTRPTTAVFALQLAGWAYQPPAGDQTCLGYLPRSVRRQSRRAEGAHTGSCCLLRPWLRVVAGLWGSWRRVDVK
jgi:hypothetical protein